MIRTGPSSPKAVISRPKAAEAPLPCVYRLGEVKTESMAWVPSLRACVLLHNRLCDESHHAHAVLRACEGNRIPCPFGRVVGLDDTKRLDPTAADFGPHL